MPVVAAVPTSALGEDPENVAGAANERRDWVVWAVLAGGLVALVLFGSLSVQHGPLLGFDERVVRYWPRFTGLMKAWGFPHPVIVAVWAAGAVAAVASLVAIRLAIAVPDAPDDAPPAA